MTVFVDSFGGADKTLDIQSINGAYEPVPEPSTVAALGLIGGGLLLRRRRR